MAATNSLITGAISVTLVKQMHFGGSSTKARRRFLVTFTDATNGIAIGGTTHKFLAADLATKLGSSFTKFDNCSSLLVFTTSGAAPVAVIPASVSTDQTYIVFAGNMTPTAAATSSALAITAGAAGTAVSNELSVGDVQLATTQSGQITVDCF